jgi:hypothetical protein
MSFFKEFFDIPYTKKNKGERYRLKERELVQKCESLLSNLRKIL